MEDRSDPEATSSFGSIAGDFVEARIAAFGRAHSVLCLCKACLQREIAARRVTLAPRTAKPLEPFGNDWCFLCGAQEPTLAAVPRPPRNGRRVA